MATKRIENSQFVYLSYDRRISGDFDKFKLELLSSASLQGAKDIVVDLSGFTAIGSAEVGALVRIAHQFKGTMRYLRIVPSPEVAKTLASLNLHKVSNISIYENREAFITALKRATGG